MPLFANRSLITPRQAGGTAAVLTRGLATNPRVKCWEIIAGNLSKSGWSWGGVSALDLCAQIIFVAVLHQSEQFRGRVPVPDGHTLISAKGNDLGQMALRQFADQSREIQHALALVGGIHTLPEAHALHGRSGSQRLSEKNDIVLVFARVFAEPRGSALDDTGKLSAREHDHAQCVGKACRKRPFNFVYQSGGIGFLIPEDDIAALNQGGDIHATDAFKTRFEVAHPDDVAPADIDAAKQCKVVAGCQQNSLHQQLMSWPRITSALPEQCQV